MLRQYIRENITSPTDSVKFFFSGYLQALEEGARNAKVELDMTYDTLNNVKPALIALADIQNKNGYDNKRNSTVTAKTLASYLTLMAINNHKVKITVEMTSDGRKEKPYFWADMYQIKLNGKIDSDFLPYAIKSANSGIEVDNGIAFNITPLVGAYKRATRINLLDYGFDNMIVVFDPPSEEIKDFLKAFGKRNS